MGIQRSAAGLDALDGEFCLGFGRDAGGPSPHETASARNGCHHAGLHKPGQHAIAFPDTAQHPGVEPSGDGHFSIDKSGPFLLK